MADDHTDFAVEQDCRIGMDTQNIGSGTGSNLVYKKFEQRPLQNPPQIP